VRYLRFVVTKLLMCFAAFPRPVPTQDSPARVTILRLTVSKAAGLRHGWGCPALVEYFGSGTGVHP
jgi:hypothetical protein